MLSSPKISEALSSLKQIVEMQSQKRGNDTKRAQLPSQSSRQGARCDIRNLEMPPLQFVLTVLGQVKGMKYLLVGECEAHILLEQRIPRLRLVVIYLFSLSTTSLRNVVMSTSALTTTLTPHLLLPTLGSIMSLSNLGFSTKNRLYEMSTSTMFEFARITWRRRWPI